MPGRTIRAGLRRRCAASCQAHAAAPRSVGLRALLGVAAYILHHQQSPHVGLFTTRADNWSIKAIRRKTTGSGRMRYLKTVQRRFKNGFREGVYLVPG